MINRVTLHGRLTDTPELRHTAGDRAVCSFDIANDVGFGDKKVTHFFSCVAWGSMAEFLCKHFTKGQEIIVSGQLQTRQWFDRDGRKREVVEVLVRDADFCGASRPASRVAAKTALPASDGNVASRAAGSFRSAESQAGPGIDQDGFAELAYSNEDLPF